MKFEITIFENNKENVLVKNIGEVDYIYNRSGIDVTILKNKEKKLNANLAKALFGDWEQGDLFSEIQRRKNKGIFSFEIITKVETEKRNIEKEEAQFEITQSSVEFPDLLEVESVQCEGYTKLGNRCKRMADEGLTVCALHK